MHIVIAPDSFKGSLSAAQAAACISKAVEEVFPSATVDSIPMADGGEGTVDALLMACGGKLQQTWVTGPLGDPVLARWGILSDGTTAIIEMAAASGLLVVPEDKLDPLRATTFGTGELIRAALDARCTHLIVGIGGSATNDGGAGMAQALGARFLDTSGCELNLGGLALQSLQKIDVSGLDSRLRSVSIKVACDVTNPLYGPRGAAAVYGPQKGASPEMISQLDRAMTHYATVLKRDLSVDVKETPGAGAAGGLGAGLLAFTSARLLSGVEIISDLVGLDERLSRADVVITGEGCLDDQTFQGKTLQGISARAKVSGVPLLAIAGSIKGPARALCGDDVRAAVSIISGPVTLSYAISNAPELLTEAAGQVLRILKVGMELNQAGVECKDTEYNS